MVARLIAALVQLWNHSAIIRCLRIENERLQSENESLAWRLAAATHPLERAAEDNTPLKPIRLKRPDYASAQSDWEWQHNKRAREIMDRARDGFL